MTAYDQACEKIMELNKVERPDQPPVSFDFTDRVQKWFFNRLFTAHSWQSSGDAYISQPAYELYQSLPKSILGEIQLRDAIWNAIWNGGSELESQVKHFLNNGVPVGDHAMYLAQEHLMPSSKAYKALLRAHLTQNNSVDKLLQPNT